MWWRVADWVQMSIVVFARWVHAIAAIVHAGLFVVGLCLSTDFARFAIVRYHTKQPFDPTNVEAVVHSHVNLLGVLTWGEAVTAVFECAYVVRTFLVRDFRTFNHNPLRWIEYSITATMITVVLAIGSGLIEFEALSLLIMTGVLLQFTGYVAERAERLSTAIASVCVGHLILALQIWTIFSSDGRRSWDGGWKSDDTAVDTDLLPSFEACRAAPEPRFDVWTGNLVLYAVYYSLFGMHAVMHLVARRKRATWDAFVWADFRFVDITYTLLSLSSKVILFTIVVTSFKTYEEHYSPCAHRVTVRPTFSVHGWARVRMAMYVAPSVITVALAVGARALVRREQRMLSKVFYHQTPECTRRR
jgi:hypothetical protein